MRDTSYKKSFDNSVHAHQDEWPVELIDTLKFAHDMSKEIIAAERDLARRQAFYEAVAKAANSEAKVWFEEQALETILNG